MKNRPSDLILFIIAGLIIAGCFSLAYTPRKPGAAASTVFQVSCLEDPSGAFTLADVARDRTRFESESSASVYRGRSRSAFWIRCSLARLADTPGADRYLEIQNPNLEDITVFFPGHEPVQAGKRVPMRELPIRTRLWYIPVPDDLGPDDTVYLRVKSSTVILVPLSVVSGPLMTENAVKDAILYSGFFGILLAVFVINLFFFFFLRHRTFASYLAILAALIVYQLKVHGFLYWLPLSLAAQNRIEWLSLGTLGVFLILFTRQYLFLPLRNRPINHTLLFFLALYLGQTAIGMAGYDFAAGILAYTTGFFVPILIIAATIYTYMIGHTEVRFYLIAWVAIFSATLVWTTAPYFEAQLPANLFLVVGTSLGTLLFTLSIFERIRDELYEKEAIAARENYYLDLSRTDALTGLYNRRYLNETVKRFESANTFVGDAALIMIDMDNFKTINDTYGHLNGDTMLMKFGALIRQYIRKSDLACRYGGDEFLVLLPGAGVEIARRIAEELRAAFSAAPILADDGQPIPHTISLGITGQRTGDTFDGLFLRADAALYQAKKTGRNRVAEL